jgi:hypothetical protein
MLLTTGGELTACKCKSHIKLITKGRGLEDGNGENEDICGN